jgi:predicted DNA-binding transcriptional regulator YafY
VNRTDRLYALVEELRAVAPASRSAGELARRFEVSRRTIERDLSALQQSGVPIYATPGRRGGYAIDAVHTLPPLNLTAGEVTAVAAALAAEGSTPFTASGRSALQKMLAVLRDVDAQSANALAERVRIFDRGVGRVRPPAVVEHAIIQRRVVTLDYVDNQGVPTDRTVEPVAVLGVAPNWYLWAWCRLRSAPRAFRLDRIRGARLHDEVAPERGMDPAGVEIPDLVGRGIIGHW